MIRGRIRPHCLSGWLFAGLLWGILVCPRPLAAETAFPGILILNSYHQGYAWSENEITGIRTRFQAVYPEFEPSVEHLDAKRFPGPDQIRRFTAYLQEKYRDRPVDLIMALDNSALELILGPGEALFPDVPVVFAGVNGFHPRLLDGRDDITGITESQDVLGTIRLGLKLFPDTTKILLVHDHTNSGLALRRETETMLPELKGRVPVVAFTPRSPLQDLLNQLKALPPTALVLILTYATDAEGRSLSLPESTALFASHCSAPLLAMHETRLGHGILGGMLVQGVQHGERAANIALRVLNGALPSDIPAADSISRPMFDHLQLARFRVNASLLPEDSVIINKPVSFWVAHHDWLFPLFVIVGVLIVFIAVLSFFLARIKKAEQAAWKSREQFRQVTETIREVFWLAAPDRKKVDYVSPPYEPVWGRSRAELQRNPWAWYKSVIPADRPALRKAIQNQKVVDADEITLPDFRIRRPDGSVAWISARAFPVSNGSRNPERLAGIAEDITESKRDEAAIQTIMEVTAGATGQALFDKIVDRISDWLGCEVALIGEIQPDRRVKTLAMVVDGKPVFDFEYDLKGTPCEHATQQGFCYHPVDIARRYPEDLILAEMGAVGYVGVPVKDRIGTAVGVLCAISRHELKISPKAEPLMTVIAARASVEIQRKQVEAEKSRLESQLLQSQKMEAIGTLAGGIAHDFNNILFPILGYAEMLQEDLPPDSPLRANAAEILAGTKRARDLTKQILAFGRQVRHEIKPIRIQTLLKEVIRLTRSTLPATIEIHQDIDPGCGTVMADPTHIHQVAMNLITNAYHAMENGGVLTIALDEAEVTSEHPNPEFEPGVYIRLRVRDTGVGMDPATREKIFDPYFSTKEKDKGTGLGLSVVHGIIKNLGGHITVRSAPNRGSTFDIWIPRSAAASEERRKLITAPLPRGTEHILLVDDEETIARMEKQMLERLGYAVTMRTGSIEALAAFQAEPEKFDLVITDMTMPGITGDRLALKMMAIRPDLPIILCTGFSERMSAEKAASLGIGGFVMKPVVQSELAALIRKILEKN